MKKIPAILCATLLAAVLALSGCADAKSGGSEEQTEEPLAFAERGEFMMGCLYGGVPGGLNVYDANDNLVQQNVPIPDVQYMQYYRELKEAGFTMVSGGYHNMNYQAYLRGLKACEEVGLKMLVYDADLVRLLMNENKSDEQVAREAKEYYGAYFDSPAFAGISVADEPAYTTASPANANHILAYKKAKQRWDTICPGKLFYINLLPIVAGAGRVSDNYGNYIKQFTDNIDDTYFSYDHYVMHTGSKGNYLGKTFIQNFVTAKMAAPDARAWTVLLSIKHLNYRELTKTSEATFQLYTALACGYEGFSWFCFWPPVPNDGANTFGAAAYDRQTNQKTATYDIIKNANNEVKQLQNAYFHFDWKGIKTVIGTENDYGGERDDFAYAAAAEVQTDRIASVKTQQDTLIGVFKAKEGVEGFTDGYMLVNYTEPSEDHENKIELTFTDCTRAAIFEKGVQRVVKVTDGKLTLTQRGGDGTFVIPLR